MPAPDQVGSGLLAVAALDGLGRTDRASETVMPKRLNYTTPAEIIIFIIIYVPFMYVQYNNTSKI